MTPRCRAGAIVAFRERHELGFGLVTAEEKKGRVAVLRARGKEDRVNESRIVVEVAPPDARASAERLAEVERETRRESEGVDVAALWEIVAEAAAGAAQPALETAELAELALGSTAGPARAATFLALLQDGVHFALKGETWAPRAAEIVEGLLRERRVAAQREAEAAVFLDGVRAAGGGEAFRATGSETERRFLDALERLATLEDGAATQARQLAHEALTASGLSWDSPAEGAFKLLLRLGRFDSRDFNLQPLRFALRTTFPEAVTAHAAAAAERGFDAAGRVDLTAQAAVSIDSAHTREIDDLIFVERSAAGGWHVSVHIADPAAFVEPGDPVDEEALARGLTHYMPDLRIPMIPQAISEQAASLVAGEERPALSFRVELDAAGCVTGYAIVRSRVRSAGRLTYDEADASIAGQAGAHAPMLADLAAFGALREQMRAAGGAVTIRAPEVEVRVLPDATPVLERLEADSASRRAVSEAMILSGEIAARYCVDARIPAIFRRQTIAEPLAVDGDPGADPVLRRRLRRSLPRAETGLEPGPHDSLGLEAYAQASSPLRRFQDLATHRQIVSCLAGRAPCYEREALQRVAASTEQAEANARRAEQAADEYWLLRYLEGRRGEELDAVVVELEPRPIVQLVETLREQPLRGLAGVRLGERIRVRVEHVNPRAGRLVLTRV